MIGKGTENKYMEKSKGWETRQRMRKPSTETRIERRMEEEKDEEQSTEKRLSKSKKEGKRRWEMR